MNVDDINQIIFRANNTNRSIVEVYRGGSPPTLLWPKNIEFVIYSVSVSYSRGWKGATTMIDARGSNEATATGIVQKKLNGRFVGDPFEATLTPDSIDPDNNRYTDGANLYESVYIDGNAIKGNYLGKVEVAEKTISVTWKYGNATYPANITRQRNERSNSTLYDTIAFNYEIDNTSVGAGGEDKVVRFKEVYDSYSYSSWTSGAEEGPTFIRRNDDYLYWLSSYSVKDDSTGSSVSCDWSGSYGTLTIHFPSNTSFTSSKSYSLHAEYIGSDLNGDSVHKTIDVSFTQPKSEFVYGQIVIDTFSYIEVPAKGTEGQYIYPVLTFHQDYYVNGTYAGTAGPDDRTYTITWDRLHPNGRVMIGSKGANEDSGNDPTVEDVVSVTISDGNSSNNANGTAEVKQEANKYTKTADAYTTYSSISITAISISSIPCHNPNGTTANVTAKGTWVDYSEAGIYTSLTPKPAVVTNHNNETVNSNIAQLTVSNATVSGMSFTVTGNNYNTDEAKTFNITVAFINDTSKYATSSIIQNSDYLVSGTPSYYISIDDVSDTISATGGSAKVKLWAYHNIPSSWYYGGAAGPSTSGTDNVSLYQTDGGTRYSISDPSITTSGGNKYYTYTITHDDMEYDETTDDVTYHFRNNNSSTTVTQAQYSATNNAYYGSVALSATNYPSSGIPASGISNTITFSASCTVTYDSTHSKTLGNSDFTWSRNFANSAYRVYNWNNSNKTLTIETLGTRERDETTSSVSVSHSTAGSDTFYITELANVKSNPQLNIGWANTSYSVSYLGGYVSLVVNSATYGYSFSSGESSSENIALDILFDDTNFSITSPAYKTDTGSNYVQVYIPANSTSSSRTFTASITYNGLTSSVSITQGALVVFTQHYYNMTWVSAPVWSYNTFTDTITCEASGTILQVDLKKSDTADTQGMKYKIIAEVQSSEGYTTFDLANDEYTISRAYGSGNVQVTLQVNNTITFRPASGDPLWTGNNLTVTYKLEGSAINLNMSGTPITSSIPIVIPK